MPCLYMLVIYSQVYSTQSYTRAEYNSLRAPRAGNLGRTPRDDNRDDVFNCQFIRIYSCCSSSMTWHILKHEYLVYFLCL